MIVLQSSSYSDQLHDQVFMLQHTKTQAVTLPRQSQRLKTHNKQGTYILPRTTHPTQLPGMEVRHQSTMPFQWPRVLLMGFCVCSLTPTQVRVSTGRSPSRVDSRFGAPQCIQATVSSADIVCQRHDITTAVHDLIYFFG